PAAAGHPARLRRGGGPPPRPGPAAPPPGGAAPPPRAPRPGPPPRGAARRDKPPRRGPAPCRAHRELRAAVKLKPATDLALPPARPLRVRLAFGLDLKARDNVARWIDEWNKKDGARLGQLQLVEEETADLVMARYTERDKVRTRTTTGPDLGGSGPAGTRSAPRTRFELEVVPV